MCSMVTYTEMTHWKPIYENRGLVSEWYKYIPDKWLCFLLHKATDEVKIMKTCIWESEGAV